MCEGNERFQRLSHVEFYLSSKLQPPHEKQLFGIPQDERAVRRSAGGDAELTSGSW